MSNITPITSKPKPGSAFANLDNVTTYPLSSGYQITLRNELPAGDALKLMTLLGAPTEDGDFQIIEMFLDSWTYDLANGQIAPVSPSSLYHFHLADRTELTTVVQAHAIKYLERVIPASLKPTGDGKDPLAETTGPTSTPTSSSHSESPRSTRKARSKS